MALIREKTVLLLLAAVFSLFALMAQKSHGGLVSFQVIPLNYRLENAVLSYAMYLKKLIWPMDLAVFYPHPMDTISITTLITAAIFLSAVTILVIVAGKAHSYLLVGWFWYLGTMIPVSGISQSGMQAMADRFAYVPFIGLYIMFAWGTSFLTSKIKLKFHDGIYVGIMLTVAPILMVLTHNQLSFWRNSETLYTHTLQVTRNNYIMHYAMGDLMVQKGRLAEAKNHFVKAMRIEPRFTNAIFNVGKIHQMQGKKKDALLMYNKILDLRPDYYPVLKQLGYLWLELEHFDHAVFYLKKAVHLKPEAAPLHNDLGYALLRDNKTNDAVFHFKKAIQLEPENSAYQENYRKARELASSIR